MLERVHIKNYRSIVDATVDLQPFTLLVGANGSGKSNLLRLLADLHARRKAGYVPSAAFVNAYLGLGENDQAFVWLEEAYKEQSNILQFLKVHPFFDPIRSDPRFVELVRRVGLN